MAGGSKTYEMLWDCRYCGSRKNLGKTHRHCPNCGAQQDATARYFPAESEKVAVEDHVFVGADVQCPGCGFWSGRAAACCGGCGAPLSAAREAQRRADQVAGAGGWQQDSAQAARQEHQARMAAASAGPGMGPGAAYTPGPSAAYAAGPAPAPAGAAPAAKPKSRALLFFAIAGTVLLGLVGLLLVTALWTKDAELAVVGQTWTREIAVESLQTVNESAWCDQLPAGARGVSRSREVRSHKKVADGETCSNRRVDNGDGTFSERRECTTRYRDEPQYSDRCRYDVDRWRTVRTLKANGGPAEEPRWPPLDLTRPGTGAVGSEREGARSESYVVVLRAPDASSDDTCSFDQAKWKRFRPGTKVHGQVRVLTGGIDCTEIQAP